MLEHSPGPKKEALQVKRLKKSPDEDMKRGQIENVKLTQDLERPKKFPPK